jgi:hypothetical protein
MSESEKTEEDQFLQKAKARFDESVEELDGASRSRLNRARHAAIEASASGGATIGRWTQWVPAGGVAAAAVVAAFFWNNSSIMDTESSVPVDDFEILITDDSFEMLEDLEFYSWIDIDAEFDGGNGAGDNVG